MKLNKTLIMAGLIAGSVLAADIAVYAQDSTNTPAAARPPGARARLSFDTVATQLALTDEQKTKAKPIFEEMDQKRAEIRKDTTIEAADKRAKYKEIRDNATTKLKDILTPPQFEKWQKMGQAPRRAPVAPSTPTPPAGDAKTAQ